MLTIRCCQKYNKYIYKFIRKLLISNYTHRPYNTNYYTLLQLTTIRVGQLYIKCGYILSVDRVT